MIDDGNPPVPPRRTKRKNKSAPIAPSMAKNDAMEATDDAGSRQEPLPEKCQWDKSRFAVENRDRQRDIAASCSKTECVNERFHRQNCNADIVTGIIETNSRPRSRDDDTISTREIPPRIDKANDDLDPAKSAALKPRFLPFSDIASPKRRTLDKYPPLFFTLHDFENVMSATWDRDNTSSAILEEKSSEAQILDEDICFRVTTTSLPFEKCLDKWRGSFENDEFAEKFDDYQLDNNKNKNDQSNVENLSNYKNSDNYHVGTKVRFVIDDASSSKHNDDVKIDMSCNNLQSCEPTFGDGKTSEQNVTSFVNLIEIREESADVKDCGDNLRDKLCASRTEKGNTATRENDSFMLTDTNKVDTRLKTIPQTYYDDINDEKIHKENSNFTSRNEHVSNENLGNKNITTAITKEVIMNEKYAEIQTDQSEMLDASSEIVESIRRFSNKSLETICNNEETNAKITEDIHQEEDVSLKRNDIKEECDIKNEKISFNESLLNLLNNRDDKSNNPTNDFTNESFEIEKTRGLSKEENKEESDFADCKYNCEEASPSEEIFAKGVPVKIRRNSFLETMLSDDSTDTSINCPISTKSIISPISMEKELNIPNESVNEVRESDITKKSIHLCDFSNKTIKIDTENKKDSENMKEKIVKVSSADVKSMQSENKNACDVKNDVLNELLCNFNNIKLKIVSPENKKPEIKTDGDKNIARPIVTDNRISKAERASPSKSLEIFESDLRDISISSKISDINTDIVKKIAKEEFTKISHEERNVQNSACNSATDEKIIENKNNGVTLNKSSSIKNKSAKDNSIKRTAVENTSSIRAEGICMKTRIEETFEGIKDADEVKRDSKKLRGIRVPKAILKKKIAEQQRTNTFQKRIPIGAPATMNKIFDSRDAIASRSLENKREVTPKRTHSHGKEKTDEVIAISEADDDRRRVANRSTLALLDTMGSDDKCAIARRTTSVIPCNNDNNRAVTPVVNVSNDQSSRDVVTITPGKVRSFVKYYEIRGDATTVERHSKIKDREKVSKRKSTKSQAPTVAARNSQPEVITGGKETRGRSVIYQSSNTLETSSDEIQSSTFATNVPKDSADSICKTARESKVTKGYEKSGSHVIDEEIGDRRAPLAKIGAKKSVQFQGGFTVIHPGTFDENESAGIVTDYDANALKKRRAPGIPPSRDSDGCQELTRGIKESEKLPDAEESSFQRREAVAQVGKTILFNQIHLIKSICNFQTLFI